MKMTVSKRMLETFGLFSQLAQCSQCGAQFLAASHVPLRMPCILIRIYYVLEIHDTGIPYAIRLRSNSLKKQSIALFKLGGSGVMLQSSEKV